MDKRWEQMTEGHSYLLIDEFREKRKKKEIEVAPEKKQFDLSVWRKGQEELARKEIEAIASNYVQAGNRAVVDTFSPESLVEQTMVLLTRDALKAAPAFMRLQLLPHIQESLESALFAMERGSYDMRLKPFDDSIKSLESKLPKRFDPSMINKDPRFPIDRIGQTTDGKFFDRWLTDALNSKPILFDSPGYIDKLKEFYTKIYKPAWDKEQDAKAKAQSVPPPQPTSFQEDGYSIPQSELKALYGVSEEGPRFASRIYKGAK